jgi:anti-sigma B factor antagonist
MSALDLQEEREGWTVTLSASGELDFATAPELEVAVRRLCLSDPPHEVILDLNDVSFIDITGVRTILTCKQLFDERQCGFWVMSVRARAHEVLERYGLLDQLPLGERPARARR